MTERADPLVRFPLAGRVRPPLPGDLDGPRLFLAVKGQGRVRDLLPPGYAASSRSKNER